MPRTPLFLALLICAGLSIACSPSYRLQVDPRVPEEIADAIRGRELREGSNLLVDFDTHKLFARIEGGRLASLVLEVEGRAAETIDLARLPDPSPTPTTETPQSCTQRYDRCLASCGDDRCCRLECYVEWIRCEYHLPGVGSPGGLSIL